jgi:hypothetical protein
MESTKDTAAPESLLDEADFLEQFASLEDGMTAKPRQYAATSEVLAAVRTRPPGKFVEAIEPPQQMAAAEGPPPAMQQIAAIAMFVFMMAVGAAGAAVVFHDRVARILAAWQ